MSINLSQLGTLANNAQRKTATTGAVANKYNAKEAGHRVETDNMIAQPCANKENKMIPDYTRVYMATMLNGRAVLGSSIRLIDALVYIDALQAGHKAVLLAYINKHNEQPSIKAILDDLMI